MQIRPATHDDLPALVQLGAIMHAESPRFSQLSFDHEKVFAVLGGAIGNPPYFFVVAEDGNGDLAGGFIGMSMPHWFSSDEAAHDMSLFIKPGRRGGIVAARLVKAFISWAQERGAKQINLGISTGVMVEQTAEFYRALGLRQYGYLFEV